MTSYLKLDFEAAAERRRGRLQAVSRAIATFQLVKLSILGELKGSCKAKSCNSTTKAFSFWKFWCKDTCAKFTLDLSLQHWVLIHETCGT